MNKKFYHFYHLVDSSPWPFLTSISCLGLTLGGVLCFNSFKIGKLVLFFGFLSVILISILWWRDVVRESSFQGHHTIQVQAGLKLGVVLFIVSEIMFFSAFFWAFFHSSLVPSIELGSVWPPIGIKVFNPWEVPFLNTLILLLSGASVTWAHYSLLRSRYLSFYYSMSITIGLAVLFTLLQGCEYMEAAFGISDSVYGSTFYMATGFHGLHVIIGTTFLIVCFVRSFEFHFSKKHHLGFEAASWYWHFVDVVWLFLFISIYWWGNKNNVSMAHFVNDLYNESVKINFDIYKVELKHKSPEKIREFFINDIEDTVKNYIKYIEGRDLIFLKCKQGQVLTFDEITKLNFYTFMIDKSNKIYGESLLEALSKVDDEILNSYSKEYAKIHTYDKRFEFRYENELKQLLFERCIVAESKDKRNFLIK